MGPESNKEQAKKFGNELENGIIFVDILTNLLKLFYFNDCLFWPPLLMRNWKYVIGNFLHF
jgi:hypothetical protein